MQDEKKTFGLNDKALEKVNGGGISVTDDDYCHFNPSRWYLANGASFAYVPNQCRCCVHNTNPNEYYSNCEYSK